MPESASKKFMTANVACKTPQTGSNRQLLNQRSHLAPFLLFLPGEYSGFPYQ
jgi:hypothetical protein